MRLQLHVPRMRTKYNFNKTLIFSKKFEMEVMRTVFSVFVEERTCGDKVSRHHFLQANSLTLLQERVL